MSEKTIENLAKQFIEGEWNYDDKNKILKKAFATKEDLIELKLIDENGYLDSGLKQAIITMLGEQVMRNAMGPFNDNDIFSGDILDDTTLYNLEFHQVKGELQDLIKEIPNVVIKIVVS